MNGLIEYLENWNRKQTIFFTKLSQRQHPPSPESNGPTLLGPTWIVGPICFWQRWSCRQRRRIQNVLSKLCACSRALIITEIQWYFAYTSLGWFWSAVQPYIESTVIERPLSKKAYREHGTETVQRGGGLVPPPLPTSNSRNFCACKNIMDLLTNTLVPPAPHHGATPLTTFVIIHYLSLFILLW